MLQTYLGERGSEPRRATLAKIFQAFPEINSAYLTSGIGEPLRTPPTKQEVATAALSAAVSRPSVDVDRVTFVPEILQGGFLAGFSDPDFMRELPEFLLPGLGLGPGQHFCFPVRGTSMLGTIDPGDLFVGQVVQDRHAIRPGEVYALWLDDGSVVKRVRLGGPGELVLHSDNLQYDPYTVSRTDVRLMLRFEMRLSFSSANNNLSTATVERLLGELSNLSERLARVEKPEPVTV